MRPLGLQLDDVPIGSMRMVKVDGRRLCLVRTVDGVHALDHACPHEGYGLTQGELDGDLLTCAWHNWKFRVDDGACVLGEEDVRTHPVDVDDDGDAARHARSSPTRPSCARTLLASLRRGIDQRLHRPGGPRRRPAAARRRQSRRADLGGRRLRRAARRVRLGPLDRIGHRLPGDDRPLRRRPARAADRAGRSWASPRRSATGRSTRCPIRRASSAATRAASSAGWSRPSSWSRRRRCCAARSTPAGRRRAPPVVHRHVVSDHCLVRPRRRSTPRRRSSCSTCSAGSGPTPCCRTSCRRSCTARARTSCRTCGRSTAALAQLDLRRSLARRRTRPDWADDGGLRAALLGGDRTVARRSRRRRRARATAPASTACSTWSSTRSASGCCATTPPASSTSTTTSAGSTSPTA